MNAGNVADAVLKPFGDLVYVSNRAEPVSISKALEFFARGNYLYSLDGVPLCPFSMRNDSSEVGGEAAPILIISNDRDHPPFSTEAANAGPFYVDHWSSPDAVAHKLRLRTIEEHDEQAKDRVETDEQQRARKEDIRAKTFSGSSRYGRPKDVISSSGASRAPNNLRDVHKIRQHGEGMQTHVNAYGGPSPRFPGQPQHPSYAPDYLRHSTTIHLSDGIWDVQAPYMSSYAGVGSNQVNQHGTFMKRGMPVQPQYLQDQPQLIPVQQIVVPVVAGSGYQPSSSFQHAPHQLAQQTFAQPPVYFFGSTFTGAPVESRQNRPNPRRRQRSKQHNKHATRSQYNMSGVSHQGAFGGPSRVDEAYQHGLQHVNSSPASGLGYSAGALPSRQYAPLQGLGPVQRALSTEKNLKMEEQKLTQKQMFQG